MSFALDVVNRSFEVGLVAAFIGVLMSTFYFFIGKIFGGELEAKSKSYLLFSIFNTFLVVFLPSIFYFLSSSISAVVGSPNADYLLSSSIAIKKLDAVLASLYFKIFILHIFLGIVSGLGISFPLANIVSAMVSVAPFAGLDVLLDDVDSLLVQMLFIYGWVVARDILLNFSPALFVLLFPLGVLFRSLVFTRKVGSSMMALAIALFFAYPSSILLTDYLLVENVYLVHSRDFSSVTDFELFGEKYVNDSDFYTETLENVFSFNIALEEENPILRFIKLGIAFGKSILNFENLMSIFYTVVGGLLMGIGGRIPVLEFIGSFIFFLGIVPWVEFLMVDGGFFIFSLIVKVIYLIFPVVMLFVVVFLSLILEIVFTVTVFRAVSSFLGGESQLLGLSRLI